MLIHLREGLKNSKILKFVFVGIISVPFVFFGFGSYFTGGADVDAATVNGQAVPTVLFERANLDQQQRMRQMFGGRVPSELLNTRDMREGVLEALVNEELMLQRARSDYYTVSDLELAKAVQSDPNFLVDGQFDRERYQQILSANRSSPQIYEETLRRQLVLQQLYQALTASDFVLEGESQRVASLQGQEREISRLPISLAQVRDSLTVTEDEVAAYYDNNVDAFMRPEQFKVAYLDVDASTLADGIELSDAEVEASYQRRISEFGRPERREASHILINLEEGASDDTVADARARIDALLARLDSGEEFAVVAAEGSEDAGSADIGGSLGEFERGVMTPAFDDAVFSLEQGTYSDVVRTDFGFHIIKVDSIIESTAAPLEEVRDEVESELRRQLVSEQFADQRETLSAETFENPNSLDSAADFLNLEVEVSDWISEELTDGLGAFPAVLAAVQTEDVKDEGLNSELIDLGPERVVVVRVEDYQPEEIKPFDEVREQAETLLLDERAQARADEIADEVLDAVNGGADLAALAANYDAEYEAPVWVGRRGAEVDPGVLRDVFEAAHPSGGSAEIVRSVRGNGDPVLVAIHAVRDGEVNAADLHSGGETAVEDVANPDDARALAYGSAAFRAVQQAMRADADVTLNERVLDPDFVPYGAQGQHGGM